MIAAPSQSSFALMFGPDDRTPIVFYGPGNISINPPFTSNANATAAAIAAGGATLFVFQLVCKALGSGAITYEFSQ